MIDPQQVLRSPCRVKYRPSKDLRRQVSVYFSKVIGRRQDQIAKHLPDVMTLWGKMRIRHGDAIRCHFALQNNLAAPRNNSFIRVSVLSIHSTY